MNAEGAVIYWCNYGRHFSEKSKVEGATTSTRFFLGQDAETALKKKKIIGATWRACVAQGHKTWPPEPLRELCDKGIISPHTAKNASAGAVNRIVHTVVRSVEEKNADLQAMRDPKTGVVPVADTPIYLATLVTQELTDPSLVEHLRKYLHTLAYDCPKEAILLFDKVFNMQKEAVKTQGGATPQVNINFDGLIAYDARKNRKQIEANVVETIEPEEPEEPTNG